MINICNGLTMKAYTLGTAELLYLIMWSCWTGHSVMKAMGEKRYKTS